MFKRNPRFAMDGLFAPTTAVATILLLLPFGTYADEITPISRAIDLDGDGLAEIAQLRGLDALELKIFTHDGTVLLASGSDIGWRNGPTDEPRLDVTSTGSLAVISEHLNGPSKYSATLTVAFRNESYRIVGVTYEQWGLDFADPVTGDMRGRRCDMNLLTGTGLSNFPGNDETKARSIEFFAPVLNDWRWKMVEEICGQGAE